LLGGGYLKMDLSLLHQLTFTVFDIGKKVGIFLNVPFIAAPSTTLGETTHSNMEMKRKI
jgi:hypothetical protein